MTKNEALTKLFDSINGDCYIGQDEERKLVAKIKEALEQPVQDDWRDNFERTVNDTDMLSMSDFSGGETDCVKEQPAQKPLSDDAIAELWGEKWSGSTEMIKNFACAIEKAHGIGVEND